MIVGATNRSRPVGLPLPGRLADLSAKKCFATSNPFSWSGWFSWLGMGVPCRNVREEDVGATVGWMLVGAVRIPSRSGSTGCQAGPAPRAGLAPPSRAGGRARAYPSNFMLVITTEKFSVTIQRTVGATLVKTISITLEITVSPLDRLQGGRWAPTRTPRSTSAR